MVDRSLEWDRPLRVIYAYRPSLRARTTALGLALLMSLLIIGMLIRLGMLGAPPGVPGSHLTSITLSNAVTKAAPKSVTKEKAAPTSIPLPQPAQAPVIQPRPVVLPPALKIVPMTSQDFAASDISKLPKAGGSSASGSSKGNGAVYGPGAGPSGAQMYKAEWYREPSRAEMVTYMPHRETPNGAWAMIACRTIEHYHVEDCRELGESPPGSGLSRGLRQAAWQFLVRPPRLDGKPLMGVWVSIRFDFYRTEAKEEDAPAEDDGNQ